LADADVFSIPSRGNLGAGGVLFQFTSSSVIADELLAETGQSSCQDTLIRRNCLFKLEFTVCDIYDTHLYST